MIIEEALGVPQNVTLIRQPGGATVTALRVVLRHATTDLIRDMPPNRSTGRLSSHLARQLDGTTGRLPQCKSCGTPVTFQVPLHEPE